MKTPEQWQDEHHEDDHADLSLDCYKEVQSDARAELEQENKALIEQLQKAEAACASLSCCFEHCVMLLLGHDDSDMLNVRSGEKHHRISDGHQDNSTQTKEAVQGVPSVESERTVEDIGRLQNQACHEVESQKKQTPREVSGVFQTIPCEAPGKVANGLSETRPLQGSLQNHSSECGGVRESDQTGEMSKVWVGWEHSRSPQGLQQALRRAMALQVVPHEVASEILNALSSDCGKGWCSPEEKARLEAACCQLRSVIGECTKMLANYSAYWPADRQAFYARVQMICDSSNCGQPLLDRMKAMEEILDRLMCQKFTRKLGSPCDCDACRWQAMKKESK